MLKFKTEIQKGQPFFRGKEGKLSYKLFFSCLLKNHARDK